MGHTLEEKPNLTFLPISLPIFFPIHSYSVASVINKNNISCCCLSVRIIIRENVDLIRLQKQLTDKSTALRVTQEKFNNLQEVTLLYLSINHFVFYYFIII